MRIAANVALSMLRSSEKALLAHEAVCAEAASQSEVATPEINLLKREDAEVLRREIACLPEKLREPVVLRYFFRRVELRRNGHRAHLHA